jgi:hypothetical protein
MNLLLAALVGAFFCGFLIGSMIALAVLLWERREIMTTEEKNSLIRRDITELEILLKRLARVRTGLQRGARR